MLVNRVSHFGLLTVKQFPPIAPFAQHFFPTAIILKQALNEALVDIPLAFGGMSSFGKRSFPIEARSAERIITLTHAKESWEHTSALFSGWKEMLGERGDRRELFTG